MQLDQGLAEMEELDALLDDEDSSPYDTPAMSGPANLEAEPTVRAQRASVRAGCAWDAHGMRVRVFDALGGHPDACRAGDCGAGADNSS
jgi:hypothetical protein